MTDIEETKKIEALVRQVREGLAKAADPEKAEPMQAYMKSAMPYRGVKTPLRRKVAKAIFDAHPLSTREAWEKAVLDLWRDASYREERHAALDLTCHRFYRSHQVLASLPMYEEMIVDGAWWDYVDLIATRHLGAILLSDRPAMTAQMRLWSQDSNLWKRRSSILCQLKLKEQTDLALFYEAIEGSIDDKEFFARKAIGWALREHGKTDPDEVRRYVAAQGDRLSPLSRREALKNL